MKHKESFDGSAHTPSFDRGSEAHSDEESAYRVKRQYSVRSLYGPMDGEEIRLHRSKTRSTILDSLLRRVSQQQNRCSVSLERAIDVEDPHHEDQGEDLVSIDPELVTWDGPDDPENPRNWKNSERVLQTFIVTVYTFISPVSSSMLSPAMDDIAKLLDITNAAVKSLCVSIMVLAWAVGPLVISPISESDGIGRLPVLNLSIWIVAVFNLACGFAKTPLQFCIFRFLGGLGGCTPLNVGAGTLADLWNDEERLYALAAYSMGPTFGPVVAPVIGSFIVTGLDWHWCFYILAIFNFVVAFLGLIFFKETYAPALLKQKAIRMRKASNNPYLHTLFEIADGDTTWERLATGIKRPISLLFLHPIVFGLSSFMAFTYGFMYLMIVTFPTVFQGTYGFSTNISGLMYLVFGAGYLLGIFIWAFVIKKGYSILQKRNNGVGKPEYRLPALCFSGIGVPIGLVWYGWSAEKKLCWIMPGIGLAIFSFSLIAIFLTIQSYLIEMNNTFAASSMAASAFFRSLFGFAFPLFATAMYNKLGYGWGNTLCAFIGLGLGIPFPVFCLMKGEKLRLWANRRFERKQLLKEQQKLERLRKKNEKEMSQKEA